MIQYQRNKYLETTIQTATPAQLLIMLCDGAVRFCRQGIEAIHQKNYPDAHKYLTKVQDIVFEFAITLDKNSPLAEGLLKLYDYFVHLLVEANTRKAAEPAEEVLGYLVDLKELWTQAAKSASAGASHAKHG